MKKCAIFLKGKIKIFRGKNSEFRASIFEFASEKATKPLMEIDNINLGGSPTKPLIHCKRTFRVESNCLGSDSCDYGFLGC